MFTKLTFWLTGLNENNSSLDAQASTYKLLTGQHYQSIQPKLKHDHVVGWTAKEPYEFSRSVMSYAKSPLFNIKNNDLIYSSEFSERSIH